MFCCCCLSCCYASIITRLLHCFRCCFLCSNVIIILFWTICMFMAIVSVLITEHQLHHSIAYWLTFVVCSHNFIAREKSNEKHQTAQKTLHFYWLFAIISPFSLLRPLFSRLFLLLCCLVLYVYTWHIIVVFGRNPINLDTVINEYKYEMPEQKQQKHIGEVTKQDNVCDAHAQHPTCCDHFEI